jgi:2-dehydropantoate 2-reductase
MLAAMRIGIVGAGGVGGLLAGLLARAGHDVALVARGEALAAIHARGLAIESPLGEFRATVHAAASTTELEPVDAVLIAVKTWQVADVAPMLAPWLRPGGIVVPLENGVDAMDQCVQAAGRERVVGGLCHMLSWIAAPGAIEHVGGPPRVTIGAWKFPLGDRAHELVSALASAGAAVTVADDFPAALWEKFTFIASFGGVGAVARVPAGELRSVPETRQLLLDACAEVRSVGIARGITLHADLVARTLAYIDGLPAEATSSLQRDIATGRPSEVLSLGGAVVRMADELRIAAPVHRAITAALMPLERRARSITPPRLAIPSRA